MPFSISASQISDVNNEAENNFLLVEENEGVGITVYADQEGQKFITLLPNHTSAQLLLIGENYSLIRYEIEDDSEGRISNEGYVRNDAIVEFDQYEVEPSSQSLEENETTTEEINGEVNDSIKQLSIAETSRIEDQARQVGYSKNQVRSNIVQSKQLTGIALEKFVSVYSEVNRNAKVLKSYQQGHILKYRSYSAGWYEATVYINGKPTIGYIAEEDVETATTSQIGLQGIGLKNPTKIYAKASKNSGTLKTYKNGHILKYSEFTSNWFEATVMYKGKWKTGYIFAGDVETASSLETKLGGVGVKSPTNVYTTASKNSNPLKTYHYGSILKYQAFTSDWYKATVYINGKAKTGYIHKNDVNPMDDTLTGYGQISPTTVYSGTTKGSAKLKSYALGSILKYRPFNNQWFEATVMYKGKWTTGYISTRDVGPNKPTITGYGQANPTVVYSKTSKGSTKLKCYQLGATLKYLPYNKDWYEATVMYKGKWTTGYIHTGDVTITKPKLNKADKLKTVGKNQQLILVTSKGFNTSKAKIETYERNTKGRWIRKLSVAGHLGKNGFATNKIEGDRKSPVGKYSLGTAFGQKGNPGTKMSFKSISSDDVWVDDPKSALYNTWQSKRKTKGRWKSAEEMNHRLYKYGFVINYNMNPIVPNKGSAIFFHVATNYTAGCTATSEANVISIMKWLDPKKNPVIIQTPESGLGNY